MPVGIKSWKWRVRSGSRSGAKGATRISPQSVHNRPAKCRYHSCQAKQKRALRGRNHAEGYPDGLIETMAVTGGAKSAPPRKIESDDRPLCLENPRPKGGTTSLRSERSLIFTLNQHTLCNITTALAFMKRIERRGHATVTGEEIGTILRTFPIIGGGEGYILINADDKKLRVTEHDGNWTCHEQEEHWGIYDLQGKAFNETFPTIEAAKEWLEEQERNGMSIWSYGGIWCRRAPNCPDCQAELTNRAWCELLTDHCVELEAPCEHCWRATHKEADEPQAKEP